MLLELALNNLRKYEKIVIYGAGDNGKATLELLQLYSVHVSSFCDRREDIIGTYIKGIECVSLGELLPNDAICIMVTPLKDNKRILKLLREKGFQNLYDWDEIRMMISFSREWNQRKLQDYPEAKRLLKNNERFRNLHDGQRCFILGSGPSIKKQDLSLLKDEYVFTSNQFTRLAQFSCVNSNYHIWNDSEYFSERNNKTYMKDKLDTILNVGSETECFFPYDKAIQFIKNNSLEEKIKVNYYMEDNGLRMDEESINIEKVVAGGGTVVIDAIYIAIYMGFKEIYLLGVDCTDILTIISAKCADLVDIQYAYAIDRNVKTHVQYMLKNRPLEEVYRLQSVKFAAFNTIKSLCDSKGILLRNCTEGGILEGIPRKAYEEVFGNVE